MNHSECVQKLIAIGKELSFHATGRSYGKRRCRMAWPDCVWYYQGEGWKELIDIAKGDGFKYIPFIAFEVPYSESEKGLRGSVMSLLLTSPAVGILVLLGKCASPERKSYVKKIVGRFSSMSFRIWDEATVNRYYQKIVLNKRGKKHGVD